MTLSLSLERVLEPEIMDTDEDAREYEGIDNSAVNLIFVEELAKQCGLNDKTIVDLGSGPADIPIEIASRFSNAKLVAVEMGSKMLELARSHAQRSGLDKQVTILADDAKKTSLPDQSVDVIISNSVVHHIADPLQIFREIYRIGKKGAFVFLKDLRRPDTNEELQQLVSRYAQNDTPYARALFFHSLHAALRPNEIQIFAEQAGFDNFSVTDIGDRHWQFVARI